MPVCFDPNALDDQGRIPRHIHAILPLHKDCNVVYLLVRFGADLCAIDRKGKMPMHCAAVAAEGILKDLMGYELDVNVGDEHGMTQLHLA